MTLEEYATEVLEMMKRVATGIANESAATVKAAQQGDQPETIAGLMARSEQLGYVRGLVFTQMLMSQESQRLLAEREYDARAPQ